MRLSMFALVMLAGCSSRDSGFLGTTDAMGPSCTVSLVYGPPDPIAGPATTIGVTADVGATVGVLAYHWHVAFNGTTVAFGSPDDDHSRVDFLATAPGIYDVSLDITGSPMPCSTAVAVNVGARDPLHERLRLKVVPPKGFAAPAFEKSLTIDGGASVDLGIIVVDPGMLVTPTVRTSVGGVPAYLRFTPAAAPDAIVEAFSDAIGGVVTRLVTGSYTVLVIPSTVDPPGRIANWSSLSSTVTLGAGTAITGVVRDPDGAALQGATVQLTIDGVPSTVATTGAGGSFSLRAQTGTGVVAVDVIPPASSGLPRMSASSAALDVRVPLQIRYRPTLVRRNLAGTLVMRQGAPVAGAVVMVVGTLPAGTITAGVSINASGDVRIAATADSTGALPSRLVPSAPLSAVITVGAADLAVAALDTTDSVPASLDAPPMQSLTTAASGAGGAALRGATLDLVPAGALAMAGVPPLHVIANSAGMLTAALATGGHYDLRFRDPQGRRAPLVLTDVDTATIAPGYPLPAALQIRGTVMAGTQVLPDAAIQMLCADCVGIERTKPMAEAASDGGGRFVLAVPDPGTM